MDFLCKAVNEGMAKCLDSSRMRHPGAIGGAQALY